MSVRQSLADLAVEHRNRLEALLMEFDQDWGPDTLGEFSVRLDSEAAGVDRRLALAELVKIDLQRRWSSGHGQLLEKYLRQFPDIGTPADIDPELMIVEYQARRWTEPELTPESYAERFPGQFDEFARLLAEARESARHAQASIETSQIAGIKETAAPRKAAADAIPQEFGRYRIIRELGAGAMGTVYLAHDTQLDRQVALKTPNFKGGQDDELVARFYREARAVATLHHRNICPVFDVGEIDGRHFMSMGYVKGRSLQQFIKPDQLPPPRTAAMLIHRLAGALAEAHRHNVIHRDLKPANIMIDHKREPVVMDFGLARRTDAESRMTQSGMIVGTPAYMSPEQVSGDQEEVGPAADIYALGVILYELQTGDIPFRGSIAQVVYKITSEEPKPPSEIRDGIDSRLEAICAKMMAKDRDERYQSMDEVADDLKAFLKGKPEQSREKSSQKVRATAVETAADAGEEVANLETEALNEFFAAQAAANPLHTAVEPTLAPKPAPRPRRKKRAKEPSRAFGNSDSGRMITIAGGAVGAALLLAGIVIYFKGGSVELDRDADAVVEVGSDGSITIRPEDGDDQSGAETTPESGRIEDLPDRPVVRTTPRGIRPELLSEWPQAAARLASTRIATLSPDGARVVARIGDVPLQIADCESLRSMVVPDEMQDAICLAWSADGRLIATGHEDRRIRLWDADSLTPYGEPFESPIEPRVAWVFLSADGAKLIAMATDREVKIKGQATFFTWNVASRTLLSRFEADMDDQRISDSIDASADAERVAVVGRETVTLWETVHGTQLPVEFNIPESTRRRITGMDLSRAGDRLAYGVLNGRPSYVAVLDTSTGQELWNSGKQDGRVHAVQFSPDDNWLVSTASREQAHQLSLWDSHTGTETRRWSYEYDSQDEDADRVKFLTFSANGSRLLLAGPYMPVAVWDLGVAEPVATPGARDGSPGNADCALAFDGIDDRVEIDSFPELTADEYTVEAIVRVEAGKGVVFRHQDSRNRILTLNAFDHAVRAAAYDEDGGGGSVYHEVALDPVQAVHLAMCVEDGQVRLYLDGQPVGDFVPENDHEIWPPQNAMIGGFVDAPDGLRDLHHHGEIDELRISTIARYDGAFDPPARHEPDRDTLALYHFDEGESELLIDSSSNGLHGRILGARWELQGRDEPAIAAIAAPVMEGGQDSLDLLSHIDIDRDNIAGVWTLRDDVLQNTPGWFNRLHLPHDVPDEYQIDIEAEVVSAPHGAGSINFGLLVGGVRVLATINSFPGLGGVSGLQAIDDKGAMENETRHAGQVLDVGRHVARALVRRSDTEGQYRILVEVDRETIIDWTGEPGRLSMTPQFSVPNPARVSLGTGDGEVQFTRIELTPFSEMSPEPAAEIGPDSAAEWTDLFNGRDLTGWESTDSNRGAWSVENGVIVVQGPGRGYLFRDWRHSDFELTLEYRVEPRSNRGFCLRAPDNQLSSARALELTLIDNASLAETRLQQDGGLHDMPVLLDDAANAPGEWNTLRARAEGPSLQVWLNRQLMVEVNTQLLQRVHPRHTALTRTAGRVALQHWGPERIEFRNIRMRELTPLSDRPAQPTREDSTQGGGGSGSGGFGGGGQGFGGGGGAGSPRQERN